MAGGPPFLSRKELRFANFLFVYFDVADGDIFLYYSLNTHKVVVYTRKSPITEPELYMEIREISVMEL